MLVARLAALLGWVRVITSYSIHYTKLYEIHIRKEKEPFRDVSFGDGSHGRVWCTFTEHQVDLDYRSPETFAYMDENLRYLTERGVKLFRLDAFGYTTKQIGTSCFLVEPEGEARQRGERRITSYNVCYTKLLRSGRSGFRVDKALAWLISVVRCESRRLQSAPR